MLAEMISFNVRKCIAVHYPHLRLPAVLFAKVDAVKKLDVYEIKDLVIYNEDDGTSFRARMEAYWYEYSLTVLDRFGNPDQQFPSIPQIKSKKQFRQGAIVAIALPYGELVPSIIGEVKL